VRKWRDRGVPVLADSWQLALSSGANLLLGTDTGGPVSPAGRRYADVRLATGSSAITMVSGLADAGTPGVMDIWRSRIAGLIGPQKIPAQRFSSAPDLRSTAGSLVAGSHPNGLPPGVALQAELRALADAGLTAEQAVKAAGMNAAAMLGLNLDIGRIAPGAAADMLVVDGDPLASVDDLLNIVGIVRNGRFYSVSGLVDRATAAMTVE
ncbi:MAG: amidohydrolase family protein, partial [Gammaproteobacteria bacterium]|nr:amidohydrolase family protein [Gammaproteobacteria bacterium]